MKDYAKIIVHNKRGVYQQVINRGSSKKKFTEWNALKAIEDSAMVLKQRVNEVLQPDGFLDEIKEVKIEMQDGVAAIGEQILIKAQLFTINKKEHLVKVFAHQLKSNGKTDRLAKAVYHLEITRQNNAA